jgi:hypothetical protein
VELTDLRASVSTGNLEFQWIKIRCPVEVIDVFDSFEP